MNLVIQRQAKNASAKTWQLLNPDELNNASRSWEVFANHFITPGRSDRWASSVSLESWHDDIHILVGNGNKFAGNMIKVPIAGVGFSISHFAPRIYMLIFVTVRPDLLAASLVSGQYVKLERYRLLVI